MPRGASYTVMPCQWYVAIRSVLLREEPVTYRQLCRLIFKWARTFGICKGHAYSQTTSVPVVVGSERRKRMVLDVLGS